MAFLKLSLLLLDGDKKRSALRNNLCELKALIIDEISMVSNL